MAERSRIDGLSLGMIGAGGLLVYAGIRGKSIPGALTALIQGRSPATAAKANQIQQATQQAPGIPGGLGSLGTASGQAIATDAFRYQGTGYVWDGKPALGIGNWDCSSFANWVIGHDSGLAIPGWGAGKYDGTQHGPATWEWFTWAGCDTISSNPDDALPGDLAIWDVHHMGICLGPDQMISAQNPQDGTQVSAISGFTSGAFAIRRLKAVEESPAGGTVPGTATGIGTHRKPGPGGGF